VREGLRPERCAVILLDPKGDAADAALSVVPADRTCTVLDLVDPTCGFNPLAVDAAPDAIADAVVGAMRNLFDEGDIRASSDRYLRNAIIAALARDGGATLWDAVRLLSVTPEGYAFRDRVARHLRGLPEFKEVGDFFAQELAAQLRDARAMTTSKLDAPVNKAARILNSAAVKRVLQNTSLTIDFDAIIASGEVLIVKGATGKVGAGNTAVLMQLLVGMLDASLARQQDDVPAEERVAVALKIDEAPLVINRGFAQAMALKRSAGLETVACWQMDSQWEDRAVRDQLDALFAHRVYFATASTDDARRAASLMMAAYSDQVRSDDRDLPVLARPDARLHLPKHHAICSWVTPHGRQPPFIAATVPLRVDRRSHRPSPRPPGRARRAAARLVPPGALGPARRRRRRPRARFDPRRREADRRQRAGQPARERRARHRPDRGTRARRLRRAARGAPGRDRRAAARVGTRSPRGNRDAPRAGQRCGGSRAAGAACDPGAGLCRRRESARDRARELHRAGRGRRGDPRHLAAPHRAAKRHARAGRPRDHRLAGRRALRARHPGPPPLLRRALLLDHPAPAAPDDPGRVGAALSVLPRVGRQLGACVPRHRGGPRGRPRRGRSARPVPQPAARVEPAEHRGPGHAPRPPRPARQRVGARGAGAARRRGPLGSRAPRLACRPEPAQTVAGERIAYGPGDLRLPGGRTPHGFLRTDLHRRRVEVERFRAIEPDATIELRIQDGERRWHTDLFVELDRTFKPSKNIDKFERYDHMLAGWALHKDRYTKYLPDPPLVVFICRDRSNAKEFSRAADPIVTAAHAYGGEYPAEWPYAARERMAFVAERDVHDARFRGYVLREHPPGGAP
jgi:hypothetical protein